LKLADLGEWSTVVLIIELMVPGFTVVVATTRSVTVQVLLQ